eukprot:gene21974-29034_t
MDIDPSPDVAASGAIAGAEIDPQVKPSPTLDSTAAEDPGAEPLIKPSPAPESAAAEDPGAEAQVKPSPASDSAATEDPGAEPEGKPSPASDSAAVEDPGAEPQVDLLTKVVQSANDDASNGPCSPDQKRSKLDDESPGQSNNDSHHHASAPGTSEAISPAADQSEEDCYIATESELESFGRLSWDKRKLTNSLRGVLAETAVTGVVRYKWALLRPLVEFVMDQMLRSYDTEEANVGPSRHTQYFGESVSQTITRFKTILSSFKQPPWTLQRMAEVLLEPQKQYTQLHKVSLALERFLMVTGEGEPCKDPPAAPLLSQLAPINDNPPPVYVSSSTRQHPADRDADDSVAFTSCLIQIRPSGAEGNDVGGAAATDNHNHPSAASDGSCSPDGENGHIANHSQHAAQGAHGGPTPMEHIEEDHWPEANLVATGLLGAGGGPLLASTIGQFNEKHPHPSPPAQDVATTVPPESAEGDAVEMEKGEG